MEFELKTPIKDVSNLKARDVVYLTGLVATMRDRATRKFIDVVKEGFKPPMDLAGIPVFHCGPVVRRVGSAWVVEAMGPTTSARMEALLEDFLRFSGVKLIIGKGGFSGAYTRLFKTHEAVYCALPGGVSALLTKTVKKVCSVYWLELGSPEAVWLLEVEKLGPMVVAIDCHGINLYSEVRKEALKKVEGCR
ncbi:fumarate hydratase [Candidatus Bathyarchaeota archaeon]|nr:fumarate hydratase C-terminal domain-containing protein [Candidatus Bathyarchaeota archaeon]RJS74987.1 MAG: fumarate hydratase [Candidatus Bathyarchaeota archaeon]